MGQHWKKDCCQVCEVDLVLGQESLEGMDKLPFCLSPESTATCSADCHKKALQAQGAWMLKQHLKNWQNMPFEEWNTIFEFSVEGSYALNKYNMFRTQPLQFLMTVDVRNLMNLTLGRHRG